MADYNRAIQLNPQFARAFNNRGNAHRAQREFDLAIADYTAAIRIDPAYANAYNNRGIAYRAKGDAVSAAADFAQARRLDPDNPDFDGSGSPPSR
jgi:tetratricopeptide (TPR) repeat protein